MSPPCSRTLCGPMPACLILKAAPWHSAFAAGPGLCKLLLCSLGGSKLGSAQRPHQQETARPEGRWDLPFPSASCQHCPGSLDTPLGSFSPSSSLGFQFAVFPACTSPITAPSETPAPAGLHPSGRPSSQGYPGAQNAITQALSFNSAGCLVQTSGFSLTGKKHIMWNLPFNHFKCMVRYC